MKKLFLSALIATCTGCVIKPAPGPGQPPPPSPFAEVTEDGKIHIEKPALGRTLALTRTYAMGTSIDQTNPMRTLLVYFELVDDKTVAMKEIRGNTAAKSPDDRTLSTFPAEVAADAVTFDFNQGMKKTYFEL